MEACSHPKPLPSLGTYASSSPRVGCTPTLSLCNALGVPPFLQGMGHLPSFWAMLPLEPVPRACSEVWTLVPPERLRSHKTFVSHYSVSCLHSAVIRPLPARDSLSPL